MWWFFFGFMILLVPAVISPAGLLVMIAYLIISLIVGLIVTENRPARRRG